MKQLGFFSSHHHSVSENKQGRETQGQTEEEPAENTQQQGWEKAELRSKLGHQEITPCSKLQRVNN